MKYIQTLLDRRELLEERFNSETATAATRMMVEWEYSQLKKELNKELDKLR